MIIDKIKLVLKASFLPAGYSWQNVLGRIEPHSYFANDTGGTGWWNKRKVIATDTYVLFEGSLPKCLYGDNCLDMSLAEVRDGIMRLSEDLGVPMYDAVVESLEFAHDFTMQETPVLYQRKLDSIRDFRSNHWDETWYAHKGRGIEVKFYDKGKEVRQKNHLPKQEQVFLPRNLLRYEVTFKKKGLDDIFNRKIMARDLWGKYVFWKLVAEWFGLYDDIVKRPHDCLDIRFENINTIKDFVMWVICLANERLNLVDFIKNVLFKKRQKKMGCDRMLHARIKKKIQDAMKWQKEHFKTDDLILELNNKIEQYLTYLLERSEDGMSLEEERSLFCAAS